MIEEASDDTNDDHSRAYDPGVAVHFLECMMTAQLRRDGR